MPSLRRQAESFDSGVEYFAGLFIGSDVSKDSAHGVHGDDSALSRKAAKSTTVPRPFHLMTIERHGHRGYSTNSRRIEDRKAYIQQRKEALRKAHSIPKKSRFKERKATVPQLPRLMTMQKYGNRSYSTNSKQNETLGKRNTKSVQGSSSSLPRKGRHAITIPRPPRLVTMEKNGERSYSCFSGNRSYGGHSVVSGSSRLSLSESQSYDNQSLGPKSSRGSHRRITRPRPPRLRTMEKNGERLYSLSSTPWMHQNLKNSHSWNGSSDKPLTVTVPVPFHLSSSPFKHTSRENIRASRHTFKALPLPNFEYQPLKRKTNSKLATLPRPFHLSMKNQRARSHSPPRRRIFKALPLPNFNLLSSTRNERRKRVVTVPQPFPFSITTRRARSYSPPNRRRHERETMTYGVHSTSRGFRDMCKKRKRNGRKVEAKTALVKVPLKRHRSLKSKHRFSKKHQGKGFKIVGTDKSKRTLLESVNPNLNASREARRRHMQEVALEVALLREEWRLYKEEAERALKEMEKAKKEKAKRRNKLELLRNQHSVDGAERKRAKLSKQISNLDKFIKYKSDIYVEFSQKMRENEQKRKHISLRFKDTLIERENETLPIALTIRGKHRNIRRSSSIKMMENISPCNFFSEIEVEDDLRNESLSESDDELQEHAFEEVFGDIMSPTKSQYEERESVEGEISIFESMPRNNNFDGDLIESRDKSDEGTQRNITDSQSSSREGTQIFTKREENEDIVIQKEPEIELKQSYGDLNDRPLFANGGSQMLNSTQHDNESRSGDRLEIKTVLSERTVDENEDVVIAIPDIETEQLREDLDENLLESRNTPHDLSSERVAFTNSQDRHHQGSSEEEPINPPKEFRLQGHFGDDFEVSPLINLFRGGWHRALTHEHLSQSAF